MILEQLLHAGRLDEAVARISDEVKNHPLDYRRRTSLFELLCLAGQWQRAERVLESLSREAPGVVEGTAIYRKLLAAESQRRMLGINRDVPRWHSAPAPAGLRGLEGIALLRAHQISAAAALFRQAETLRPKRPGLRNGQPFKDIRDLDDRFAGDLEFFLGDEYRWIPLSQVRSFKVYPPRHLRDLVFAPALADFGQGSQPVFLPVRYPDSDKDDRDDVRFGQRTTYREDVGEATVCFGQKVFLIDDQPVPLLELGEVKSIAEGNDGVAND